MSAQLIGILRGDVVLASTGAGLVRLLLASFKSLRDDM